SRKITYVIKPPIKHYVGFKKMTNSIVAGMGPAGLSSALSLLIKGHNVTLIDKRMDYTLNQKVIIPEHIITAFMELGLNTTFLYHLRSQNGLISLRKFQNFQLKVLNQIIKNRTVSLAGKEI